MPETARPPVRIALGVPCLEGNAESYVTQALGDAVREALAPWS